MPKDFLSDAEMKALEGAGKAKSAGGEAPDFISDEAMAALETKPQQASLRILEETNGHRPEALKGAAPAKEGLIAALMNPERWKALVSDRKQFEPGGKFHNAEYAATKKDMVFGSAPLAAPAAALPRLAQAAEAVNKFALGRVGLSGAQGAISGALTSDKTAGERMDLAGDDAKRAALIQAGFEAVPYVGKFAKTAFTRGGAALTGVPEDAVANYFSRTDQVNDLVKKSGKDLTVAADQVREGLQDAVRSKRSSLSKAVGDSVAAAKKRPEIPIKPILDALEDSKKRLDPIFHGEAIGQIEAMIAQVKQGSVPEQFKKQAGMSNAKYLGLIKEYLQGRAAPAYMQNGQIFQQASQASRAAKGAAAVARKIFNKAAPEAAEANNRLSLIHNLENGLNKNLLAPGKPDAALFAAGSGANARNFKRLEALGEVSGYPIVEKAKDLASAKYFASPSLLPTDTTGKAFARMAAGAGLGSLMAGPIGTAVGGALTSPATLKAAINAANWASPALQKATGWTKMVRDNPAAAHMISNLFAQKVRKENAPAPLEITPEMQQFFEKNPKLLENVNDPKVRAAIEESIRTRSPAESPIQRRLQSGR